MSRARSIIVLLIIIIFSAEFAQPVLNSDVRAVYVHIYLNSLHLRSMILHQTQLGIDALSRTQRHHVGIQIGHDERLPSSRVSERNEVYDVIYVPLLVLHEAFALYLTRSTSYRVSLNPILKVFKAMSANQPFQGIVFVGSAFLSASSFLAFCHDTKLKSPGQRYVSIFAH